MNNFREFLNESEKKVDPTHVCHVSLAIFKNNRMSYYLPIQDWMDKPDYETRETLLRNHTVFKDCYKEYAFIKDYDHGRPNNYVYYIGILNQKYCYEYSLHLSEEMFKKHFRELTRNELAAISFGI